MSAANVDNENLEFCSELVAHVYQEFYLIGGFNNSHNETHLYFLWI